MCIASSDAHVAAFSHNRAVAVEGWAGYEAPRAGVLCQMIHVSVPRVSSFFTCISWPLTTFFFYVQLCRTHLFGATKLHSRNESSNVSRASTQLANVSLKDHWYNLLSLSLSLSLTHSHSLTYSLTYSCTQKQRTCLRRRAIHNATENGQPCVHPVPACVLLLELVLAGTANMHRPFLVHRCCREIEDHIESLSNGKVTQ